MKAEASPNTTGRKMDNNSGLKLAIVAFVGVVFLVACLSNPVQQAQPGTANPWSIVIPSTTPASLAVAELDSNVAFSTAQAEVIAVQRQIIEATSQAQATADAYHYGSTATAEFWHNSQLAQEATATAQAFSNQATSQARADFATATAQSLIATAEARQAERAEKSANLLYFIIPLLVIAFLAVVATAVIWIQIKFQAMKLETQLLHNRFFETRSGSYFLVMDNEGQLLPQLLQPTNQKALTQPTQARIITVNKGQRQNGLVYDPHTERANTSLVRWLLREAIKVAGPRANQLPGWRHLPGFSAEKWTKAVNLLKSVEAVETIPGQGTYLVGKWETLTDVLNAIDQHEFNFLDNDIPLPHSESEGVYA